ncbi:MAG: ACP S-malonyltransferase [Candidatus Izemoplasma sp.]
MKIAFMFSGQGSQYKGMGEELYNNFDIVKIVFDNASRYLGYELTNIIFNDEELLNNTLYTQVAIYTLEAAILKLLKANGIESEYSFGLSLGEYGAYLDSDVYTFEEGLAILSKRSFFMNEAAVNYPGKMSAIIGIDKEVLLDVIDNKVDGYVKIANYNTYGQLVISGEEKAVISANKLLLEAGAKRAILLNTSGAFHSKMMTPAANNFASYLDTVKLNEPNKKILVNVTGDFYKENIKEVMVNQITNSVMYYQMIEKLIDNGVDTFIEIGPKKSLCGFVKKIDRKLKTLNVEDVSSFNNTVAYIKEN